MFPPRGQNVQEEKMVSSGAAEGPSGIVVAVGGAWHTRKANILINRGKQVEVYK